MNDINKKRPYMTPDKLVSIKGSFRQRPMRDMGQPANNLGKRWKGKNNT